MNKLIKPLLLVFAFLAGTGLSYAQDKSYSIDGRVQDADTGEPVSFAYLHIEELNRTAVSDAEGLFSLRNIPSGTYTLTAHRIGFRTQSRRISIEDTTLSLDIKLKPSVLSSESIQVVGQREELAGSGLEHASRNVFGNELRRNLGSTLAQSLSNLPGFDQRSNGSAPSRPVIRGLGGERVVILQDGITTGDISGQSADHAVTVDPSSADEIEIARGPAALAYGANAIGGVVNIVKNQISSSLPSRLNGTLSLSGETVNAGASGVLSLEVPGNDIAFRLNLNGRLASDTRTPSGTIDNTYYRTTNDALGISYIRPWGYVGASATLYGSRYGIPPAPKGHPNGVDIEMLKIQYDARSEIILKDRLFKVVESELSFKDYNHKEIEGEAVIGTEFDLLTTNFNLRAKHGSLGVLEQGTAGGSLEFKDYVVDGAGTPPSQSLKTGAYLIEESDIGNLHLEAGLRFDLVFNTTSATDLFYPVGARNGNIDSTWYKNRSFAALSSSAAAIFNLGDGFSVGGSFIHSFRPPSLEELYSEGPHLASYSFEIGNPDLEPERALAKEVFLRYNREVMNAGLTLFHNDFSNYLYARNTGRQNVQRADLQDYQFTGTKARLYGVEFSTENRVFSTFVLSGSMSYTIGERKVSDEEQQISGTEQHYKPLPMIPPFKVKLSAKYVKGDFELGSRLRLAADQKNTGDFESPTEGYSLLDLFAQYRLSSGKILHTFSLNLNNLLDETWYNHLSRIKDIRPGPGRNISLLYRLYF